jgi:hypothetical protein
MRMSGKNDGTLALGAPLASSGNSKSASIHSSALSGAA